MSRRYATAATTVTVRTLVFQIEAQASPYVLSPHATMREHCIAAPRTDDATALERRPRA